MYADITFKNDKNRIVEDLESICINKSSISLTNLESFYVKDTLTYTFVGAKNTISVDGSNILCVELVKTDNQ